MSSRFNNSIVYNQLNTWLQRVQRTGIDKFTDVQTRQHLNISNIDGELEIRLGKFDNSRYIGGLDISDWESICNVFTTNFVKFESSVRIYYPKNCYTEYPIDTYNIPHGFNTEPLQHIIKEHPQKYKTNVVIEKIGVARRDFTDLGMRAAYKLEVSHDITTYSKPETLTQIVNERHRTRRIYKLGDYYQLHMTKITSFISKYDPNTNNKNAKYTISPPKISYEAEIELMVHVDLLHANADILTILTREIISYLYIIEQIYTLRTTITRDIPYSSLNIEHNGLMNKPGDLDVNDLPIIVTRYTATDKADGIRMFLTIDDKGRMIMSTGTGIITPIRIISSTSSKSTKTSTSSNTSAIGDMFDGMLDYIYDAFSTLGSNTTDNTTNNTTKKNNNIKNTSGYTYLDTALPTQLINDTTWHKAIFDCEYLVDGRGRPRLYIFDCISCGEGHMTYTEVLLVRLACVNRFTLYMANNFKKVGDDYGYSNGLTTEIDAKHLYVEKTQLTKNELDIVRHLDNVIVVDQFSHAVCKLWQSRHDTFWYDLDGIIFTPLDGPYLVECNSSSSHKPLKIYKWKDEQTIDVRIHLSNDGKTWLFHTGVGKGHLIADWQDYSYIPSIGLGKKGNSSVAKYMKDCDIIEMIWDNSVKQFVPYRNRTADKDWPNSPLTIASIIQLVKRPVGIEDLVRYLADGTANTKHTNSINSKRSRKKANSMASVRDRSAMEFGKLYYQEVEQLSTRQKAVDKNMRDFHNYVKANLIHRITPTNGRKMLLDLSVGKAGDLNKWVAAGVDVIIGIDISGTAIAEARRRYQSLEYSKRRKLDAYFINGDSTQDITVSGNMCLDSTSKQEWQRFCNRYGIGDNDADLQIFNMVVSNFAIHYIVETSEQRRVLCRNLARCLVPNGLFVGTLLDADIILREMSLLKSNTIEAKTDSGDVFYRIDGVVPNNNHNRHRSSKSSKSSNGNISNNKKIKKIIVSRTGWANPIPEPAIGANEFCKILRSCYSSNSSPSPTHSLNIKWHNIHMDTFQSLYTKRVRGGKELSKGEKYISFMHKTFIATRNDAVFM